MDKKVITLRGEKAIDILNMLYSVNPIVNSILELSELMSKDTNFLNTLENECPSVTKSKFLMDAITMGIAFSHVADAVINNLYDEVPELQYNDFETETLGHERFELNILFDVDKTASANQENVIDFSTLKYKKADKNNI